jgi:hypothetical protein
MQDLLLQKMLQVVEVELQLLELLEVLQILVELEVQEHQTIF